MLTRFRAWLDDTIHPDVMFPTAPDIQLALAQGDITKLAKQYHVEAVVNAANLDMRSGGGVCGAIYDAAGFDALEAETLPLTLKPGAAVATSGYMLSKYIIHTAAPVWNSTLVQAAELANNYISAMRAAQQLGATSIAIPLLGAGIYGWPAHLSAEVAAFSVLSVMKSTQTKLRQGDPMTRIFLVAYTEEHYADINRAMTTAIKVEAEG